MEIVERRFFRRFAVFFLYPKTGVIIFKGGTL